MHYLLLLQLEEEAGGGRGAAAAAAAGGGAALQAKVSQLESKCSRLAKDKAALEQQLDDERLAREEVRTHGPVPGGRRAVAWLALQVPVRACAWGGRGASWGAALANQAAVACRSLLACARAPAQHP